MTTTTTRTTAAAPRTRQLTTSEQRGARLAGRALLLMTLLSLPAAVLLGRADEPGARAVVATAFLVVAALDVAAGWGLHLLLRGHALPTSVATVVSRSGYAVLLAVSALVLLVPGGEGVAGFRSDWALALVVFGVHLTIAAVALWRSRLAPGIVVVATAIAGAAYLVDDVLARSTGQAQGAALVPFMLGELVLMGWLLWTARRSARRAHDWSAASTG